MPLFQFFFFSLFFLQTVQTVLHITTKNRGSQPLKKGLIQVLGEQKAFHQVETFHIFSSFPK